MQGIVMVLFSGGAYIFFISKIMVCFNGEKLHTIVQMNIVERIAQSARYTDLNVENGRSAAGVADAATVLPYGSAGKCSR